MSSLAVPAITQTDACCIVAQDRLCVMLFRALRAASTTHAALAVWDMRGRLSGMQVSDVFVCMNRCVWSEAIDVLITSFAGAGVGALWMQRFVPTLDRVLPVVPAWPPVAAMIDVLL